MSRVSLFLAILWVFLTGCALSQEIIVDNAVIKNDIKQIFKEINEKTNRYQDWQELFPCWTEQEIINFFELWQMTSLDFDDATKRGIQIWGPSYEITPEYKILFQNGVDPSSLTIALGCGRYALLRILKNIIPDQNTRSVVATLIMASYFYIHNEALLTHYPYGYRPPGRLPTFTVLRIKW